MEKEAIMHEDMGQEWMAERRHQAWEDGTIAQLAKDCHTSTAI